MISKHSDLPKFIAKFAKHSISQKSAYIESTANFFL